ncbi:MAG: YebC/PmpR family DNA-binding transcriptional regulator [Acidimicrobiia bacterium]|nr:YebC/PmpR family DNA-binding transcriptional regulator [Acidimicrobiia bacterium]MYF83217.1 YebC/PmpR family DNA-binding transcriptional regulator [Acidimicrobiia bacterium]
MAGHSKWANIKHRKGRQDAARGNLFAKLCRAVEAAARQGGGDPAGNAVLATAIDKARSASVPKDNIERAIKRGTGELVGERLDTFFYEGYAPGGVALLVQALTDNRNRAASDIRSAFTRNGGNLGEPGSVAYLFDQKGYLLVEGEEDDILMAALESGAEDVRESGDQFEVITAPTDFPAVRDALASAELSVQTAEITQLPSTTIPLDASGAARVLRLVDTLDDLADVQGVYGNFDIPDDYLATLAE